MLKKCSMSDNCIRNGISGILAFLWTLGFPRMLNLRSNELAVTNSWLGVVIFGVAWYVTRVFLGKLQEYDKQHTGSRKHSVIPAVMRGVLFPVCMIFGAQLDANGAVAYGDVSMWLSIGAAVPMTIVWFRGCFIALEQWQQTHGVASETTVPGEETEIATSTAGRRKKLSGKQETILLFVIFLLCWLPVLLAVYPGFFAYDALDELTQVHTHQFTTHHPLMHVLALGGVIQVVFKLTGSNNLGIFVYMLLQMCFMSGVFTYVLMYMKRKGVQRWIRIVAVLWYGLFPVNVMFTICSSKDGIFSAALLILLTSLLEMGQDRKSFWANRKQPILFFGSALIMICFRHNGMYALLVLVPVLIIWMKGHRKQTTLLLGAVFVAYYLLTTALTVVLKADDSENQEILTVPIQQITRVWNYENDTMTAEQKDILYEVLDPDALDNYRPKVSDMVKYYFDNEAYAQNPMKYAKLWAEVGLTHIDTYLDAWFMTSYGFWYPDTVIDIYTGNKVYTLTYEDSSYFQFGTEPPGELDSKIPWLCEWYRQLSLEITQQKWPVLSMLFSPGFMFWVYAFAAGYVLHGRRYQLLLPFGMLLLLWLTVILGPTYLTRYVLIFWFALPGVLTLLANRR